MSRTDSTRRRPPLPRRVTLGVLLFLAAGAAATVLVSFALAAGVDLQQATPVTASEVRGDERREVWRWDRPGAAAVLSARHVGLHWSPRQATGPPDTPGAGDQVTAWATSAQDAPGEWLELDYATAVVPKSVRVYETDAPGAVCRVTAFRADGGEVQGWAGADPTPATAGSGVSDIPLSVDFPTKRVRIYLASEKVPGWNEIDAVALVGPGGQSQWAVDARASSFYGDGGRAGASVTTPGPAEVVPDWAGAGGPGLVWEPGQAKDDYRVTDARGWPMLALCSRRVMPASAAAAAVAAPIVPPPGGGSSWLTSSTSSLGSYGGTTFVSSGGSPAGPPPASMPLRPIWPGFAVDAVLYAAGLALLRRVLTAPRRVARELSRLRKGRCIACGYDLGYDFVRGCPECGWRRPTGPIPLAGASRRGDERCDGDGNRNGRGGEIPRFAPPGAP